MYRNQYSRALKALFVLILPALFISSSLIVTRAFFEGGVKYSIIQDLPGSLVLDETYEMIVDCKNTDAVPYHVWAEIALYGPSEEIFTNNDVFINLVSLDENGDVVSNFTIGRNLWIWGFHWNFTQIDRNVIKWTGMPTIMSPGAYRTCLLYVSILGSAPVGDYKMVINVFGERIPVQAEVSIKPKTLNIKSEGKWIEAHICLPKSYDVKNVDVNSMKLWFKDNFVQAEWGRVEKGCLIAKFSRDKVIELLKGESGKVKLTVTGLVNSIEFYGTDMIKIVG